MLTQLMILAQETTTTSETQPGGLSQLLPLFAVFGLFIYFMLIRPQSKERKKFEALLASIKKNDRVVTKGGIIGTVASVRDDEMTLKVDESSNTKITFRRDAIAHVLSKDTPAEKDAS